MVSTQLVRLLFAGFNLFLFCFDVSLLMSKYVEVKIPNADSQIKRIEKICENEGMTFDEFLEKALRETLEKFKKES